MMKKTITDPLALEKSFRNSENNQQKINYAKDASDFALIEFITMNFDSSFDKGIVAHELHRRKNMQDMLSLFIGAFLGAVSTEVVSRLF